MLGMIESDFCVLRDGVLCPPLELFVEIFPLAFLIYSSDLYFSCMTWVCRA